MHKNTKVSIVIFGGIVLGAICLYLYSTSIEKYDLEISEDSSMKTNDVSRKLEEASFLDTKNHIKDSIRKHKKAAEEFEDLKGKIDVSSEKKTSIAQIGAFYWEHARDVFEDILAESKPNEVWGKKVKEYLDKNLNEETYPGTNVVEVDCRTELCKVTLAHNTTEAAEIFEESGHGMSPWGGRLYVNKVDLEDGNRSEVSLFFPNAERNPDWGPFDESRKRILEMYDKENR